MLFLCFVHRAGVEVGVGLGLPHSSTRRCSTARSLLPAP